MKNKKTVKIVGAIAAGVAAAAVLVLVFFAGWWTRGSVGATPYDWALGIIEQYYYKDIDTDDAGETAVDALVEKYLDIYSAYYTPEEYKQLQESNAGNRSGFGISSTWLPGEGVLVVNALGNSPAFASGLRAGDVMVSGELGGELTQFASLDDFSSFAARAGEGEEVTVNCASGESFTFAKAEYATSYVLFATNDSAWTFTGEDADELTESTGDAISYLPEGAAYVWLSQFYGNAPAQFEAAMAKFNELGCTSLVIDLRSDGGGYVSVMQRIAGCFENCRDGSLAMEARYRDGSKESYPVYGAGESAVVDADTDIYVLANSGTASASEALIGCLVSYGVLDYGDIYISEYSQSYLDSVGLTAEQAKSGRTYGKGIMQTSFYNPATGQALKLTTAQIYWPDGTTIHDVGLPAAAGCRTVEAPLPIAGDGQELRSAVGMIFGLS